MQSEYLAFYILGLGRDGLVSEDFNEYHYDSEKDCGPEENEWRCQVIEVQSYRILRSEDKRRGARTITGGGPPPVSDGGQTPGLGQRQHRQREQVRPLGALKHI